METRVCTKCGLELPIPSFSTDNRVKSGKKRHCKTCDAAYSRSPEAVQRSKASNAVRERARLQVLRDTSEEYRRKKKAHDRLYRQSPAGKITKLKAKARRRAKGGDHRLTVEEWGALLIAFNHSCAYCLCSAVKLTADHFIPLAAGGHTVAGNIVPACVSCNSSKQDKPPQTWCSQEQLTRVLAILDP